MVKLAKHVSAYLRGVALLILALLFPLIVIIMIANFFVARYPGTNAWRMIWAGVAAVELTFLASAAVQWKRAWDLTVNRPGRRRLAVILVVLAVVLLGGVVVLIAANIRNTCDC
jgi:hypothetical protein